MKQANITRKDLAKVIHDKIGFAQRDANELVDTIFACMKKKLLAEESIKLVNFGTLMVKQKKARPGRNFKTGETVKISRRSTVSFLASKLLREKINS